MNPELNGGSPTKTFFVGIGKTALMFNVHGDENYRHNLGGTPMLDPIVGILFWIGVIIVFCRLNKIEYFLLLMWVGALSLPEILTAEGIPHALRIVGIMPVVFLCIGLALDWIITKVKLEKFATYIILGLLIISGVFGYYKYFVLFPTKGETGEAYAEDMVAIARDINRAPSNRKNILIVGEYGTKTVAFITNSTKNNWVQYEARNADQIVVPKSKTKVFVSKDWIDEAKKNLGRRGFHGTFIPIHSNIDNRVIYYEYQN